VRFFGKVQVGPSRLDIVKPRTFYGELADLYLYPSLAFGSSVVFFNPAGNGPAGVPESIVPHHDQAFFALLLNFLAHPLEELICDIADGPSFQEPKYDLVGIEAQEPVATDRYGIGVGV